MAQSKKTDTKNGTNNRRTIESVAKTSADILSDRIQELGDIFPEAISEGKIDFEKLRNAVGNFTDERAERYSFTWAGKRDAIRILQIPSRATLASSPKESINFQDSNNIFIEGENLEVLKLLYKSYFGRVKMIYIDPPYNTGNDFVYPDNFADPLETYLKLTGQKDTEGNLLTSNPETSGRYHSAWLSMMYPRLFIARQLLKDDGVIFISIDDKEVHNLRMIMNEIFGEENFIETIIWKKRATAPNDRFVGRNHEYILIYGKLKDISELYLQSRESELLSSYSNPDNDVRGEWRPSDLSANGKGGRLVESCVYPIRNPQSGKEFLPPKNKCWLYNKEKMEKLIQEGRVGFREKTGGPFLKRYLSEVREGVTLPTIIDNGGFSQDSAKEIRVLFGEDVFEFPKPIKLMKKLITCGSNSDDIILDFMAGSCTIAQAVLELNHEDNGNRRFILVQLPEPTPDDSTARKSGFKTIAEVGKERIRQVIKKFKKEEEGKLALKTKDAPEDLGFKVFKLTESNYKPWTGIEEKDAQAYIKTMEHFTDPLVSNWKTENVIWEVAIKEGYGLNSNIEQVSNIKGNTVYRVTDPDKEQSFRICLDNSIKKETLKTLNLGKDNLFICRDAALNDEAAANLALQCRLKTI